MFFDNWFGLWRVLVVGSLAYAFLVVSLRRFGKRTLAKMNAFDLVVTVALGSTLATVLLTKEVALLEGCLAFVLLAGLQFAVSWFSVRSRKWRSFVKSEPRLLLYEGRILEAAMRDERITPDELRAAIRARGLAEGKNLAAIVLEADGSLSVIPQLSAEHSAAALEGVRGYPG